MFRIFSIIVVFALLAPSIASAQARLKPEAQVHLDAALKAYEAKDYDGAIGEFELAYQIDPNPALLYATAQAYRLANRCNEALDRYRRYLGSKPSQAQVAAAHNGIELCEAAVKPTTPPPPPPPTIEPPPPTTPPAEPSAPAASPITSQPSEASPSDTRWYKDRVGDSLVVGGIVGIGVGVGFLVMADKSADSAKTAEFRSDFITDLDETTQRRRIGAVALGAGSAFAVTGVLVYVLRDRHARPIVGGIDGRSVFIQGRF